jgi:hypothetical protein
MLSRTIILHASAPRATSKDKQGRCKPDCYTQYVPQYIYCSTPYICTPVQQLGPTGGIENKFLSTPNFIMHSYSRFTLCAGLLPENAGMKGYSRLQSLDQVPNDVHHCSLSIQATVP